MSSEPLPRFPDPAKRSDHGYWYHTSRMVLVILITAALLGFACGWVALATWLLGDDPGLGVGFVSLFVVGLIGAGFFADWIDRQ